jgi:hypothetical protein
MDATLVAALVAVLGTVVGSVAYLATRKKGEKVVNHTLKAHAATLPAFASGTVTVTGTGELVLDELMPPNKSFLQNPDLYVLVEFDPTQPSPPPCAGGLPDEIDWELVYHHVHDTHLDPQLKQDDLRLKLKWRVSTGRSVVWKIFAP